VIGADGRASAVPLPRPAASAPPPAHGPHPARDRDRGFDGRGEIFVDPPDYAILNPVAPGSSNLGLVVPLAMPGPSQPARDFFRARLRQLPRLASRSRMKSVDLAGHGPLAYRVKAPRAGGVMLVGDAAGFYDPFTGEGIFTALRSAELLAEVAHAASIAARSTPRRFGPFAAPAANASAARRRPHPRARSS